MHLDKTIHPPTAPKHKNFVIKVLPPSQNARHIQHNNNMGNKFRRNSFNSLTLVASLPHSGSGISE